MINKRAGEKRKKRHVRLSSSESSSELLAAAWTARLPFLVEPSGTCTIWAAGVRRNGALECYLPKSCIRAALAATLGRKAAARSANNSHLTHYVMTFKTRHVSRTRHITSRSSVGHAASHTHTGGKCTARRRESQVHRAAESQWPQVTEHLLLAATERLLQREQLAQPRQLASATPPAPGC